MKKTFKLKASTCLSLCIACLFLVSGLLVAWAIRNNEYKEALEAAESEAQLILDRNMATHKYFNSTLKPPLFELTEPLGMTDYFEPTWMSSTFAIREIEKQFQELNSSGYYYKECAIDARSPKNEADEFEKVFIERLNAEPELHKWSGNRTLDGEEYFVLISRGETMEESCLRCHSTPDQAPGGLVKYYGPDRSFNRTAGEVVSAISIRIPVSHAYAAADKHSFQLILIVIGIMICIFVILNLINKHFLLTPLDMIRKKASAIAKNPEHLGEEIPLPKGSELKELVGSFNKMSVNLRNSHDHLEGQVKERTRELESLNQELTTEISERKRSEQLLLESKEQFRLLYERSPLGYQSLDEDGCFVTVNPAWLELLGYSKEEVLDRSFGDFLIPEKKKLFAERFPGFKAAGETKGVQFEMVKKDGSHVIVEIDGKIGHKPDGSFQQTHCILHDISDRKHAEDEKEKLLNELAFKNKELQSIVYIVSHDLQSPLVNISGFSAILDQNCKEITDIIKSLDLGDKVMQKILPFTDEYIPESLGFISASTKKMKLLLDGLLQFSRIGTVDTKIEPLQVKEIVGDVCKAMGFQFKDEDVEVNIDNLPNCLGDANMINQLFSNLIGNAFKYLDPERKGTINISGAIDDSQSVYCVEDNGVGIRQNHQSKVFEMFHRLNPDDAAGGEGLGLTIITRILDRNNGSIRVESEEGKGSKFFVSLPTA